MGRAGPLPRLRPGVFDSRLRAGADLAASGHEAVCHADPDAGAAGDCPEHGVKTMVVPWAAPGGRFTLRFERLAVDVLLASASVSQACELLGIGWDTAQEIMRRAVERGLSRRQREGLTLLLGEKCLVRKFFPKK